jgi:hypothetical protein
MKPLYRDEIVSAIMEFVEGALGYVDLPSDDAEDIDDAQEAAYREHPFEMQEEFPQHVVAVGRQDYCPEQDYAHSIRRQPLRNEQTRRDNLNSMPRTQNVLQYKNTLSLPVQIARVMLYQLPVLGIYLIVRIALASQADSVHFMSDLVPSKILYDYSNANNSHWWLISMASITFWASVVHIQRPKGAAFGLEYSILACYSMIYFMAALMDALFLGAGNLGEFRVFSGTVLFPSTISMIIARGIVAVAKPAHW